MNFKNQLACAAMIFLLGATTAFAQPAYDNIEELTKSAQMGDADAQNHLGVNYERGNGVIQDFPKSAELYLKAANQGNPFGQANIASYYLTGKGIEKNWPLAFEWAAKSAKQGFKPAQYLSSWQCELSNPKAADDLGKAIQWYVKNIDLGDPAQPIPESHQCP